MKYRCDDCGQEFEAENSTEQAEAEAQALWGVSNASANPGMALVCDDCFNEIVAIVKAGELSQLRPVK